MTLTIDLPPKAERRLREIAAQEGKAAEVVATAVLVESLVDASDGIHQGLEDFEAGRFRSFEIFADEQRRKYGLSSE